MIRKTKDNYDKNKIKSAGNSNKKCGRLLIIFSEISKRNVLNMILASFIYLIWFSEKFS